MMHRQDFDSLCHVESGCPEDHGFKFKAYRSRWPQLAIAFSVGLGSLGISPLGAIANPLHGELIAQQVVEGLPPPPPIVGVPATPGVSVPTAPSNLQSSENLYLVYINGDSPLLLDQVRRVSTEATVQDYQGQQVIQAGVFQEPTYAQQQVSALEAQGILAEVAEVPSAWFEPAAPAAVPVQTAAAPATIPPPELIPVNVAPREIEFGRSPDMAAATSTLTPSVLPESSSNFYVVIPGRSGELSDIAAQVIQLGASTGIASSVEERTEPVGPHVRIGPFVDQGAAARWSEYFEDFGLNSRVYYQR